MATYIVKSLDQLTNVIIAKIEKLLDTVAEKVKERIDEELERYYDDYDPAWTSFTRKYFYNRTYQLRNACKISPINKGLNEMSVEIYIDVNSLNYSTPGADPWKTVVAANSGLHGGWVINNGKADRQIPWEDLNDDSNYGNVRIWDTPMEELLDSRKLRDIFIDEAKKLGLNIIAK